MSESQEKKEKVKLEEKKHPTDFTSIAFSIFGSHIMGALKYFESLEDDLRRAGLKTTLAKYVSKMFLLTLFAFVFGWVISLPILFLFLLPLFAVLASFAIGILAGAVTFIVQFIYPKYVINDRKTKIEKNLSFVTNYMAILAGAGVIPEKIFRSVSASNIEPAIKFEVSEIIRRMEVFGEDFYTALSIRVEETPSPRLAELLRGILLVGSTGGDCLRGLRRP
jgi:pilus assembly protein TadC